MYEQLAHVVPHMMEQAVVVVTAEVPLTKGQVAIIDADLADVVGRYKWHAHSQTNSKTFYAMHVDYSSGGHENMHLHRFIWEHVHGPIPEGMEIDHVNGDGLDNHLANLRLVTRRVNAGNRKARREGKTSSRCVGVCWDKRARKWRSRITVNGRAMNLGLFDHEEDACAAYQSVLESLGEQA